MTIEQTNVVDLLAIDSSTNKVHLTAVDHLPWGRDDDDAHLLLLQEKLNTYLRFIDSGEYLESMPEAANHLVRIVVIGQWELTPDAKEFFRRAKLAVAEAGFELVFEHREPSGLPH